MLQRFYGGNPTEWLSMPWPILNAFVQMKPRIEAAEQIDAYRVATMAAPMAPAAQSAKEASARREHARRVEQAAKQLQLIANGGHLSTSTRRSKEPIPLHKLADFGFEVVDEATHKAL